MKPVSCFILLLFLSLTAIAQQKRFFSVRGQVHFDFAMKVPSMDDAGFGLQLDASLFAKNKLNLLMSSHIEHLLGDKDYYLSNEGRLNKTGKILGVQAGPEYFIVPAVAVSAQYGVFWHSIKEVTFNADDGYKFGVTYLPGKKKNFLMQLSHIDIPRPTSKIRYWQFGLGYKIF